MSGVIINKRNINEFKKMGGEGRGGEEGGEIGMERVYLASIILTKPVVRQDAWSGEEWGKREER